MATPYVKQTWVDGDITKPLSAARMGVIEQGIFDAHYRPSVAVWRSAAQAIATSTVTAITWDTELYDTDAMHSTSSNTARLTAPVAGKYHISGTAQFAANATGFRAAWLRINGSTLIDADQDGAPVASADCFLHVSRDWLFAAADYVELVVEQSSGGSLNFGGTTISDAGLQMHCVSY